MKLKFRFSVKVVVLFLFGSLCICQVYGQRKMIDSLLLELPSMSNDSNRVLVLTRLSRSFLYTHPDSSLQFARQAFQLTNRLNYTKGKLEALQAIGYYHRNRGNLDSAITYFERTMALATESKERTMEAYALSSIANVYNQRGDFEQARIHYRQGIKLLMAEKDTLEVAKMNANLATTYLSQGHASKAKEYFLHSLEFFLAKGDQGSAAVLYGMMVPIFVDAGKSDTVFMYIDEMLEIYQRSNNLKGLSNAYLDKGKMYSHLSASDSSQYYHAQSIALKEQINDSLGLAAAYSSLGELFQKQGDFEQALVHFIHSIQINERKGNKLGTSVVNRLIGRTYREEGDRSEALKYFERSLSLAEAIQSEREIAESSMEMGHTHLLNEDLQLAAINLERALNIFQELNFLPGLANVNLYLGRMADKKGRWIEAADHFSVSLEHAEVLEDNNLKTNILLSLGKLKAKQSDFDEAITYFQDAEALAYETEDLPLLKSIYFNIGETYEHLSQYRAANRYFHQYLEIRDTLYQGDRDDQLAAIRAQFEAKQRESEMIQKLEADAIRNAYRAKQQIIWLIFGGLTIILGLTVFLFWNRNKQKRELQTQQLFLEQEKTAREKERAEQLIRVDQLKDQFLANTSHELRTPLHGIIGLSESLYEEMEDDHHRTNLSMVIASAKRLTSLVDDLLDFSKIKNRDMELDLKAVGVKSVVDVVLQTCYPLIGEKDLVLLNEIPRNLPLVLADENRLQQVFYNLIGNAIKFTETGSIAVHAQKREDTIEVLVEDTGVGIPFDKQQTIFEEFEQADGSESREYAGTGLGLSISKRIIELHGGTMWLESEQGLGSSFFFTLKMADNSTEVPVYEDDIAVNIDLTESKLPQPMVAPVDREVTDAIAHILIVDDEPINQEVLKNHLSKENYHITAAMNGAQALELLESGLSFDLVILDVMMPRMSGYEVCERIRLEHPPSELPVIMVTAKDRAMDMVQGLNTGANDYITKPFSREEFLARVKTHLNLQRIYSATERFVPHEFIRSLGRESITDVQLGDQIEKEVTVLFSDIRDYTSLSEEMSPEENFAFVKSYMGRMGPIIKDHSGFVNQYLGDGIMALFLKSPEDALHSAIEMHEEVAAYNQYRSQRGRQAIRVGVGLHTGSLIMGIIGDAERSDAATISDSVNTAARLEGLTKHFQSSILFSDACLMQLSDPTKFRYRFLGKILPKGKSQSLKIFECLDGDPVEVIRMKEPILQAFDDALQFYLARDFVTAANLFEKVLIQFPWDKPSQLYLAKAQKFIEKGVPENWAGIETFR